MANKLTKRKIDDYHTALGRFVSEWAAVETFLDLLLLVLARTKRKLPHQLASKISAIRSELRSSQSQHANPILRLLDEIEALAETRHDYVHGSMIGHVVTRSTLTVTLGRLLQPTNRPRRRPAEVTSGQLALTAERLREIGDALLDFTDAINREHN